MADEGEDEDEDALPSKPLDDATDKEEAEEEDFAVEEDDDTADTDKEEEEEEEAEEEGEEGAGTSTSRARRNFLDAELASARDTSKGAKLGAAALDESML